MKKTLLLPLLLLSAPVAVASSPGGSLPKAIVGAAKSVLSFIDSMTVSGVDTNYIGAPEKPWQIIARYNVNQSDMKMKSVFPVAETLFSGVTGQVTIEPRFITRPSNYVGLWAGYRGYGFGYTVNVAGDKGRLLSFGAMGGRFGLNLRMHWFEEADPNIVLTQEATQAINRNNNFPLNTPASGRTLILDGYYMFNGKRFSYAAAYDQSVIQRRSAGSVMAGAMYYYSNVHYDSDNNADFILLMNDIGRIRQWQASIGAGYAYNFVPARGVLISAMAMPMLTFVNRVEGYTYDSTVRQLAIAEEEHELPPPSDWKIWEKGRGAINGRMTWNVHARLSLTYNWNRFFVNAYGQLYNFRFSYEDTSGWLNEWFINASVGVRL